MKKTLLILIVPVLLFLSCEPEYCPEKRELLAQGWMIEEVFVDGNKVTDTDFSAYRLMLKPDNTFEMTTVNGFPDEGDWTYEEQEDFLVLFLESFREERYKVVRFSTRRLEMETETDSDKSNAVVFLYVLVPVTLE